MHHNKCPSCASSEVHAFFKIKNAPIYSLVTVKSKEEALKVPRKEIELAFCNNCGFIYNWLFDTSINYFTQGYEDQQGYSTTFMQYLKRISKNLIEKYNLTNKDLIEIGCGKGDFVNLLCELSGSMGIGIDPACQEERQDNPNLRFLKEFYSLEHGKLPHDFICCRHTLEHIHGTYEFLQLIRQSLGNDSQSVIFFEIPQISRILSIQAFWDIYYEHCSYFSPGSLARLFRRTGFEILDLHLDYSDQYLLIEAKPSTTCPSKIFNIEESIEDQRTLVEEFSLKIKSQLDEWHKRLTHLSHSKKRTVVWGGGSKAVGFLTNFDDIGLIEYVVDINPHMEGNYIPGIGSKYVPPSFLCDYKPEAVILMNGIYKDEITKLLHEMNIYPEIYAL